MPRMNNLSPFFVRISGKETRQIHLYLVHLFPIISPGGLHSNDVRALPSADLTAVLPSAGLIINSQSSLRIPADLVPAMRGPPLIFSALPGIVPQRAGEKIETEDK